MKRNSNERLFLQVIKYVVDESPYITCQILRDREPVTYDLSWQNVSISSSAPTLEVGYVHMSFQNLSDTHRQGICNLRPVMAENKYSQE